MSKPDFVPDSALFYATDGAYTFYATSSDNNSLDVWVEDEARRLYVELSRERARKVAQEILKWADSEKLSPVEI